MQQEEFYKIMAELIQNNIKEILNFSFSIAKGSVNQMQLALGTAFISYVDSTMRKYSIIKTILYKDTPVILYDFYIHPKLIYNNHFYTHSEFNYDCKEIVDSSSTSNITNISNKIIITGTAGIGKSTLLRHLFLNAAKSGEYIPVFIELRNINNTKSNLLDFIYSSMCNLNFSLKEEYFLQTLKAGKLLLLFDGFDEIEPEQYKQISKELLDLADKYDKNYFIISSRPDYAFIAWNTFTQLHLLPMNKNDALMLIAKLNFDSEIKEKFLTELNETIFDRYESFASNPLLLTIMLLTYSQCACIPDKMHIFYRQAFETLYQKHDATKAGYRRMMNTDLSIDDFRKILSCFAFQSYVENNINFPFDVAIKYLTFAKKLTNLNFKEEDFFSDLLKSVCILVQDGLQYTFSHRTFQEYFSAVFISDLPTKQQREFVEKIIIRNTSVVHLLFDIDKVKFERNIIIPTLQDVYKTTNYQANSNECYINFAKHVFSQIRLTRDGNIGFNTKHKTHFLYRLINFFYEKYTKKQPRCNTNQLTDAYYCTLSTSANDTTLSIEFFLSLGDLHKIIEKTFAEYFSEYSFCMELLQTLKERHNSQQESFLELLLKTKMS